MKPGRDINNLLAIMAALRTPDTGCQWDLAQDFASVAPYTIEEAYEVADAINRADMADLCEELGDLLLQVVFHARMAEEAGYFGFGDVVQAITAKMIRRHPHVFGDARDLPADQVAALWNIIKAQEKAEKIARKGEPAPASLLDGIPAALPALTVALKLQQTASRVGFDWNDPRAVVKKMREETDEIDAALHAGDKAGVAEEVGDLMFVLVNLARHLDVDPEAALAATNSKFRRRFGAIETALRAEGKTPEQASLKEMDVLWDAAKADEKRD